MINRLTFNVKNYKFAEDYISCSDFVGFMFETNLTCSGFLDNILDNYFTNFKMSFNFYYTLNG